MVAPISLPKSVAADTGLSVQFLVRPLVTVCAWCKQVRNKDGRWHGGETLRVRHRQISHGICPECADGLLRPSLPTSNRAMFAVSHPKAQPVESEDFPTILVAGNGGSMGIVAGALETDGYLVLQALDEAGVLRVAKVHSRRIQVLLVELSLPGPTLAEALKPFRPEMRLLQPTGDLETTLNEVHRLLKVPDRDAA